MRVIVCGGRLYGVQYTSDGFEREGWGLERHILVDVLSNLNISELAHGAASGADTLAGQWAGEHGVLNVAYPADWDNPEYRRKLPNGRLIRFAGNVRNQQMLDEFKPDLVVAFPGGFGTAHMVGIARKAGVQVQEVNE